MPEPISAARKSAVPKQSATMHAKLIGAIHFQK
jgi:hypothetical protein